MREMNAEEVRLDKWLWAARFYKTRKLAQEMVTAGKVRYNGQRSRPSKRVEPGAALTLHQGNGLRTVIIKAVRDQRVSAEEAQHMYTETTESIAKRVKTALTHKMNLLTMPHSDRRPDKKARRERIKMKYAGDN